MWSKTHLVSESFVNPLFYFVLFGFKLFPYLEKLCCLFPYLLLLYTLHVSVSFCYPPSSFTLQGRGACPPLHFGEGTSFTLHPPCVRKLLLPSIFFYSTGEGGVPPTSLWGGDSRPLHFYFLFYFIFFLSFFFFFLFFSFISFLFYLF